MDHDGHEAKHASGALEAVESRPVLVQAGEQLRVDRVGGLGLLHVGLLPALDRELTGLGAVHVAQHPGGGVTVGEVGGVHPLEQAPADDGRR